MWRCVPEVIVDQRPVLVEQVAGFGVQWGQLDLERDLDMSPVFGAVWITSALSTHPVAEAAIEPAIWVNAWL